MAESFVDNPVLNSPFRAPELHFELDENGNPTGIENQGRRTSIRLTPIPEPRKRKDTSQAEFDSGVGGDEAVREFLAALATSAAAA